MAGARLDGEFGLGEQPRDGGRDARKRTTVQLARKDQHPGVQGCDGGAGRGRGEGPVGRVDVRGLVVALLDAGCCVGPGGRVPTPVER